MTTGAAILAVSHEIPTAAWHLTASSPGNACSAAVTRTLIRAADSLTRLADAADGTAADAQPCCRVAGASCRPSAVAVSFALRVGAATAVLLASPGRRSVALEGIR